MSAALRVVSDESGLSLVTERTYVVRNANGATLGGFTSEDEALDCAMTWADRYERCGIEIGVEIAIQEPVRLMMTR